MTKKKVELPYHIFGSTAVNWAVGNTREEVLKKLARDAGPEFIKRQTNGLYAWTCLVPLPRAAHYGINNYAPETEYRAVHEYNITAGNGAHVSIERDEEGNVYE